MISTLDRALRTLLAPHRSSRPCPPSSDVSGELSTDAKELSGALMRVNHVGEICAQALYTAQAASTPNAALRDHFLAAASDETDHLAWTRQRLGELGARPSLLNPLWYGGAFMIGLAAGRMGGDTVSLGFVVETERQVEAHLRSHLDRLPAQDSASRAIVQQMMDDEIRHAHQAADQGAVDLPAPIKGLMRLAGKVMTTVAHRV